MGSVEIEFLAHDWFSQCHKPMYMEGGMIALVKIAIFAFLLHLTWELAQVPLFAGMPSAEHWPARERRGTA